MKRFSSLVFSLLIVIAIVNTSTAQDQQGNENSMLPEIDPQDIEIRSQFKARFPGLRRQPILGFDPTPRVYQIDPNRTPFMETQEQVVANLPVSELSRPAPPPYTPLHYSTEINAFGRFGIGSYVSPEAKFWGVNRINSKSYVGGDFDYSSSDGHLDAQQSSFRFFDANAEYATKLSDKSRLGLDGGFNNSFNNMFDLGPSSVTNDARKEYSGFHLGADFQHFKNTITGWKADANIRYYNVDMMNAGSSSGKSEERVYNGSLAKRWAGNSINQTFAVKLGAKGGNYDNHSLTSNQWFTAQGGVVYEQLFNYTTKVSIDANVYYASDELSDKFYIGPEVTIEHPLLDFLTLTVKGSAEPYVKTVEQLHTQNRFLNVNNNLRHSYRIRGSAEASLKYASQGTFNLGIQYEDISDYPVYQREAAPIGLGPSYLFYETNYQDIYRAKAYVSVVHQLITDRFWVNGKAYIQSPKIKDVGRIPFEEKIGVNSSVSVRPFDKLTFEAWADYVGSRRTMQTDQELGGFFLLGSQVDFQITDRFGAYVKLVNLLNQDYEVWQGYTERPFQAYGGLTIKL